MTTALDISGTGIKVRGRFLKIASIEGENYLFTDDPQTIIAGLRETSRRIDLFTFMQRVTEPVPKYSYQMEWDNYAALPITTFDHWWANVLDDKRRNAARQADKKGVTLREIPFDDVLIEGIWRIYNECPVRQGKPFPHFGMSLEEVRPYAGTFLGRSVFFGAFLGDVLIGFAKMTIDETRTQAGLMHILSMVEHRDKALNNALIVQAVKACIDRGIRYLVYANFAYGNKQRDSLSDFKRHNGFQRVDVPRYYVPLSTLGTLALRFGLHHRIIERLPESVIARIRDFRAGWYGRNARASGGRS